MECPKKEKTTIRRFTFKLITDYLHLKTSCMDKSDCL